MDDFFDDFEEFVDTSSCPGGPPPRTKPVATGINDRKDKGNPALDGRCVETPTELPGYEYYDAQLFECFAAHHSTVPGGNFYWSCKRYNYDPVSGTATLAEPYGYFFTGTNAGAGPVRYDSIQYIPPPLAPGEEVIILITCQAIWGGVTYTDNTLIGISNPGILKIAVSDRKDIGGPEDGRLSSNAAKSVTLSKEYRYGQYFECFASRHSSYGAGTGNNYYWSCTSGNGSFIALDGSQGDGVPDPLRYGAIRFYPKEVEKDAAPITINLRCIASYDNGATAEDVATATITLSGPSAVSGNSPGWNDPPSEVDYGLIVKSGSGAIRFQANSTDAIPRKVTSANASPSSMFGSLIDIINGNRTAKPGGLSNHTAVGCDASNSFAITATTKDSGGGGFPILSEVAPALRFSSTGNLQSKGGYLKNQLTICRLRGPSRNANPYGLQINDAAGNIVLDDAEPALCVSETINFSGANFANYGTFSFINMPFSKNYSQAPMIAVRTDENLWMFRPTIYTDTQSGQEGVSVLFPGNVQSNGEILIMTTNSLSSSQSYGDGENYGLQVRNEGGEVVLDTRNRIVAVTDVIGANVFTTGTYSDASNAFNLTGGRDGVDSSKMDPNIESNLFHQEVNLTGINGNPRKDYICLNGLSGRVIDQASAALMKNQWRPCVRWSSISRRVMNIGMAYAGQASVLPENLIDYSMHPEGFIVVVRQE